VISVPLIVTAHTEDSKPTDLYTLILQKGSYCIRLESAELLERARIDELTSVEIDVRCQVDGRPHAVTIPLGEVVSGIAHQLSPNARAKLEAKVPNNVVPLFRI